nr:translation initiation factor eIF-2B subunit alpha-like [Ipomoea batatas]
MLRENDGRTGKEEEAATMEGEVNGGEKTATMERKTAMKSSSAGLWQPDARTVKPVAVALKRPRTSRTEISDSFHDRFVYLFSNRFALSLSELSIKLTSEFARLYPLNQKDMGPALRPIDFGVPIPSKVEIETSARD